MSVVFHVDDKQIFAFAAPDSASYGDRVTIIRLPVDSFGPFQPIAP
jgi:hypothetical protein